MNYSTTAGHCPSSAGHSRTAAGIDWACCSSSPGAGHSRADASAAAAEVSIVRTLRHPSVVVPASVTKIPTDCYAPQWDLRLDSVAPSATTNALGSFDIAAATETVAAAAAGQVIAQKSYNGKRERERGRRG